MAHLGVAALLVAASAAGRVQIPAPGYGFLSGKPETAHAWCEAAPSGIVLRLDKNYALLILSGLYDMILVFALLAHSQRPVCDGLLF